MSIVKGMYEERIIELHVMVSDYHLFVYYFIHDQVGAGRLACG